MNANGTFCGDHIYIYISTLGPAYKEFGYNEHQAIKSGFLCTNIIDCNVKKFAYNEHPLETNISFCMFYSL